MSRVSGMFYLYCPFPGETEAEFQALLDVIEEAQIDCVGCFAYSDVDDATVNDLPEHIDEVNREGVIARRRPFLSD